MNSFKKFLSVLIFVAGPSISFAETAGERVGLNDQVSGAGVAVTGHYCGTCGKWVQGSQTTQVSASIRSFSESSYNVLMPAADSAPAAQPANTKGTDGVGR